MALIATMFSYGPKLAAQDTPPTNSQFHSDPPLAPEPAPDPLAKYRVDKRLLMFDQVEDDRPLRSSDNNNLEFQAYNSLVLKANQFTPEELEAAARKDVTFGDLIRPVRKDYQFDLVYLEGRLLRLRRTEPEKPLKEAGITDLYEGWMVPMDGSDPVCVVSTEKPPGLEPALLYTPAKRVKVAGYYFKLFWYPSKESAEKDDPTEKKWRKAPLLMAKSFTMFEQPDPEPSGFWMGEFLPGLLLFLIVVTAILFTLNWYFHRGDRRLAAERDARYERIKPFTDTGLSTEYTDPDSEVDR